MGKSNGQHQTPIILGTEIKMVKISMLQDAASSAFEAASTGRGGGDQPPDLLEHVVDPSESVATAAASFTRSRVL